MNALDHPFQAATTHSHPWWHSHKKNRNGLCRILGRGYEEPLPGSTTSR